MTQHNLMHEIEIGTKIYFVCSGNIIRSAFADLYAKHLGIPYVYSFGTTYHNTTIHERSRKALIDFGIEKSSITNFKPSHIDEIEIDTKNAIFLTMTNDHRNILMSKNIPPDRIHLITNIIGKDNEIADPYFNGQYDQTFATLKNCVDQIAKIRSDKN